MLIGLGIGMAGGITLATYALTNPKTKQNADKMLNTALDSATTAMDTMKRKMKLSFFFYVIILK